MDAQTVKTIQKIQDELEKNGRIKERRQFDVLQTIAHIAAAPISALLVIMSCPYGSSLSTMMRKAEEMGCEITPSFKRDTEKIRYTLRRLKKQNLITTTHGIKKFFLLTKKGRGKLKKLKEIQSAYPPFKEYACEKSPIPIIASFDVPEKMKGKRKWIREELISFGFKGVQKSVYIAKVKIPEEFIIDLRNLGLLPYIHIFGISKSGTYISFLP